MYQVSLKNNIITATAIAALSVFASCTTGGGDTCTKCIDNKPAPTPFSTTLNAINHRITLDEATTMINNFGAVRETLLAAAVEGSPNVLPVHETFNLKTIDSILCQDDVVGFRIYMAMDNQSQVRFVLTGVDGQGKDVIQRSNETPGYRVTADDMVFEAGQRWP